MRTILHRTCQRTRATQIISSIHPHHNNYLLSSTLLSLNSSPSHCHHRSYSNLPVLEEFIPRIYPFPLTLTTELIPEENLQMRQVNPHDLPHYKSTLRVNLNDLPLSLDEKFIFRHLIGSRIYNKNLEISHPIPEFLQENFQQRKKLTTKRSAKKPLEIKFVSSKLLSARSNENRVFQLLDECIKQSKLLCKEFIDDGEFITPSEEEIILRMEKIQLKQKLNSELEENNKNQIEQNSSSQRERVKESVSNNSQQLNKNQ